MFEKVNPAHADKLSDRGAGALVDLAYDRKDDPRVAVEVLLGHGTCRIIAETSVHIPVTEVLAAVNRIAGNVSVDYLEVTQDTRLADNQRGAFRCGDNGIFKGMPVTDEQRELTEIATELFSAFRSDGKYILDGDRLIICQSNANTRDLKAMFPDADVNPIGEWTGGTDVDSGATNRKLGSDMGDSVTGGGLHGKDLSKADVFVNIYAWLKAQLTGKPVEMCCAIGDEKVDGVPYEDIVLIIAKMYIRSIGGFEKFAEWGLIR